MPIDFPNSPTDGQSYTVGSRTWVYDSANNSWNATSITTGPKGGVVYNFSTTVTDADPGNGTVRYNNAAIGSVSFIYIDNTDTSGNTQTAWYDSWDDSTTTATRGTLTIVGNNALSTTVNVFTITGAVTVATGYYKIPVSYVSGSLPSNGDSVSVQFYRTGNQGTQGIVGSQGAVGTQGAVGAQGTFGTQGTIGSQGLGGTQGAVGAQGTFGTQGTIGSQGLGGTQGAVGAQGTFGTQGITGIQSFAQISMPASAVNGALWVDTDGTTLTEDYVIGTIMGIYI